MKAYKILMILCILSVETVSAQLLNFEWAKSMGGIYSDIGRAIAVDASGNIYTTGTFSDTADFDPGPGMSILTSAGSTDIFIQKLDPNGNLLWVKQMGGVYQEIASSIALDAFGNVYSTGTYNVSVDFDPGAGTAILTSGINASNVYIQKLDSNGNFIWAKQIGGSGADNGISIALDASGNIYTSGTFLGTVDFDPGTGTFMLTSNGVKDIFIQKLDPNGNFVYAKSIGGAGGDVVREMTVDNQGNSYFTGHFEGTSDFDPDTGQALLTSVGNADIFVLKLNTLGDFLWVKQMGNTAFDLGISIATDASGNVFTTGQFRGSVDFDPSTGSQILNSEGLGDIFIQKLDLNGNFLWARRIGGVRPDVSWSLAADASGNTYTTGNFEGSVDFDPGNGTNILTSTGPSNMFILKLNSNGIFNWAIQTKGTGSETGQAIALEGSGNIYTTGAFAGTTDFDPGASTDSLSTSGWGEDVFIQKLSESTVGIEKLDQTVKVSVYPNPSTNIYNVKFEKPVNNAELIINDIQGKLIATIQVENSSNASFRLDASPGIYILTVRTKESKKAIKLFKK